MAAAAGPGGAGPQCGLGPAWPGAGGRGAAAASWVRPRVTPGRLGGWNGEVGVAASDEPREGGLRVGGEGGNGVLVDMCRLRACYGEGPWASSGMIWRGEGGSFLRRGSSLSVCGVWVRSLGQLRERAQEHGNDHMGGMRGLVFSPSSANIVMIICGNAHCLIASSRQPWQR